MVGYYFGLALRSLRRTPVMTGLMVLAIGLGIGASMTMMTVLHVLSGDPIPARSARLFVPHVNPLPVNFSQPAGMLDASFNLTYPDAMALLAAGKAQRQAVMSPGTLLARPSAVGAHPFYSDGRYTTPDFFVMFDVPFEYGASWSTQDETARAHVVVLSETLSRKLFGTPESLGRIARLNETDFRVVGVIRDWHPQPLFYTDGGGNIFRGADGFFIPLSTAVDLKLDSSSNHFGFGTSNDNSLTSPTMSWLQMWVELDGPAQIKAYRQFLVDYSAQQKALGRFERSPQEAQLYGLMTWLTQLHLVPADVRVQLWLALGFLLVSVVNIVALLLAKFLRRSGEISVRRALGARRRDIFVQLGIESAAIGVSGGLLGVLLAQIGLWSVRQRSDDYAALAHMDASMLAVALALAVLASLMAGLLPSWRACSIAPALQLKTQ